MANNAMLLFKLTFLVLTCMVVVSEGALTCGQVASTISSCIPYVQSGAGMVPPACCSGVKSLNSMAATPADRQQACKCLKTVTGSIPGGINYNNVNSLPSKCGVNIPYKLTPTTNCNSIQ